MAEHTVLILNETVPQIQEPQAGDTYGMPADLNVTGNIAVSGTVDGRDVAADGALLDTALQPGDLASQAEAEAGTDNTKWVSPLRVSQAIASLAGIQNKLDAVTAPLTTNDDSEGYTPGSLWVDVTNDEAYQCVDATTNLAVWIKITLQPSDLATVATSGDSDDLTEGATNLLLTTAERTKLSSLVAPTLVTKSGAYNVAVTDYTVNCTSGTFALTLLDAVANPYRVHVLKNTGTGTITINTTSSQTVDGQASGAITLVQWDSLTVQSDGANWIIL